MAKIMVVEDGESLLKAVKSILEQELTAAPRRRRGSPGVSGFQVSRYVKKLRYGEDIAVARVAPMDKKKIPGSETGDVYLKKPLSRRELAETMKELLKGVKGSLFSVEKSSAKRPALASARAPKSCKMT